MLKKKIFARVAAIVIVAMLVLGLGIQPGRRAYAEPEETLISSEYAENADDAEAVETSQSEDAAAEESSEEISEKTSEETTSEVVSEETVSEEETEEASEEETTASPRKLKGLRNTRAAVTSWDELAAAIESAEDGDTITLTGDLTADSTITIDKNITLSGDYTIYRDGATPFGPMFQVTSGELTLDEGLTLSGKKAARQTKFYTKNDIAAGTRGFFVEVGTDGKLTIDGATIRDYTTNPSTHESRNNNGNRNNQPVGVSPIYVQGEFEMMSGSIVHNWAGAVDINAYDQTWSGQSLSRTQNRFAMQANAVRYNSAFVNDEENPLDRYSRGADFNGWEAIVKNGEDYALVRTNAGAVFIDAPGKTSVIKKGTISDNAGHAGAIVVAGGRLDIKGGTIGGEEWPVATIRGFDANEKQGNWGDHFGIIYVVSDDAEVRMCGGTVKNNQTVQGGGVFVTNNAQFFLMNEATIEGNNTMGNGGGMLIYSDNVFLLKGKIQDNISAMFGGGVYVYGDDANPKYQYTLTMHNAEITNNSAVETPDNVGFLAGDQLDINDDAFRKGSGGGIWLCPAGTVEFDASTLNLYDNSAENQGKDFHKDAGFEGGVLIDFGPHDDLAQSHDDEGEFTWIHDEMNSELSGKPLTVAEATSGEAGRLSIYNATDSKNIDEPKVYITGNVSRRGGGIGADGSLFFINPTDIDQDIDKGSLTFEKEFVDIDEEKMEYEMVLADDNGEPVLDENGDEIIISIFRLFDKDWADSYETNRKTNGTDVFGQLSAVWPGKDDNDYSNIKLNFPSGNAGTKYFDASETAPDLNIIMREYKVIENEREHRISSQVFRSTEADFVDEVDELDKTVTMYEGTDTCDPGEPTTFQLKYRTFNFKAYGINKEEPEIEKYIDEAVHKDIHYRDEFTYNILAYITNDADEVVITDKLNEQLEFVSTVDDVKVFDLGTDRTGQPIDSNHLPVYNTNGEEIEYADGVVPSVRTGEEIDIKGNDYSNVVINGDTLKVTLANKLEKIEDQWVNAADDQELTPYRGHYIRIQFKAKLKSDIIEALASGTTTVDDLTMEEILADKEYKDGVNGEERGEPYTGNDPVKSDEDHKGIINAVSYAISVKNEAKYQDSSNTVTVKPEVPVPEIEKYVNEDVHEEGFEYDRAIRYDIMAYVTTDANKVTISDQLVDALEFAKAPESDDAAKNTPAVTATSAKDTISAVVSKAENDHMANGSVSSEDGTDLTDKYEATIDGKTLSLVIEGDNAKALRGQWIQVTFWAKYTDDVIEAVDIGDIETITDNGAVISQKYPDEHEGTLNIATYMINAENDYVYECDSNTVTTKPVEVVIEAEKVWKNEDGSDADWPKDVDQVSVNVLNGDKVVDTIVLTPDAPKGISKKLPKLVGVEYTIEEANPVPGYISTIEGNVVTNTNAGTPQIEKYVAKDVHKEIEFTEEFPYDIIVYVPKDADSIRINDTLNDQLVYVDDADTIAKTAVVKDTNDHTVYGTVSSEDGTAIEATAVIEGQKLTVDIDDATAARGKYIQISFTSKLADDAELTYTTITDNKDVLGGADTHTGIPNDATYEIKVGNEWSAEHESNTVTVKPKEEETTSEEESSSEEETTSEEESSSEEETTSEEESSSEEETTSEEESSSEEQSSSETVTTGEVPTTTIPTTTPDKHEKSAKTGDTTNVVLWIMIVLAAACTIVLTVVVRRKKR